MLEELPVGHVAFLALRRWVIVTSYAMEWVVRASTVTIEALGTDAGMVPSASPQTSSERHARAIHVTARVIVILLRGPCRVKAAW